MVIVKLITQSRNNPSFPKFSPLEIPPNQHLVCDTTFLPLLAEDFLSWCGANYRCHGNRMPLYLATDKVSVFLCKARCTIVRCGEWDALFSPRFLPHPHQVSSVCLANMYGQSQYLKYVISPMKEQRKSKFLSLFCQNTFICIFWMGSHCVLDWWCSVRTCNLREIYRR